MIGFLRGTLITKRPPTLTLDVGGVGYELEAPMSTFYRLPESGQPLSLVTHLVVREDAHVLFGFFTEAERALFRSLLKVSNVGPRIALGVLSGMSVDGFYQCVRDKDLVSLTKIPGVGRKTAERLLVEMPDRLDALGAAVAAGAPVPNGENKVEGEAWSALVALGYKPAEVTQMLKPFAGAASSTEDLIRRALQGTVRPQ